MARGNKNSSQPVKPPRKKQNQEIESKPAEISRVINDLEYLLNAAHDGLFWIV